MAETLEVEQWWEETTRCIDCGEDIEEGDAVCWEPLPEIAKNAVAPVHPWCAVRNGYLIDKAVPRGGSEGSNP